MTIEVLSIEERLKFAHSETMRFKKSIEAEMAQKAKELTLWTNGQCADWRNYELAMAVFHELKREFYGVEMDKHEKA